MPQPSGWHVREFCNFAAKVVRGDAARTMVDQIRPFLERDTRGEKLSSNRVQVVTPATKTDRS